MATWKAGIRVLKRRSTCPAADFRKVGRHEFGHVEGLGHTGFIAIMRTGGQTFHAIQDDDKDGLIDIYGAYP